jgi:predicted RNase H-like HicB family nuclease
MELEEYLAVPYIMAVESVPGPDGDWIRRAEYPELPGCVAEAYSAVEAIEKLEEQRIRRIQELLQSGQPVPVPRPPLRSSIPVLDKDRLGFARWLVEKGRISDHP